MAWLNLRQYHRNVRYLILRKQLAQIIFKLCFTILPSYLFCFPTLHNHLKSHALKYFEKCWKQYFVMQWVMTYLVIRLDKIWFLKSSMELVLFCNKYKYKEDLLINNKYIYCNTLPLYVNPHSYIEMTWHKYDNWNHQWNQY